MPIFLKRSFLTPKLLERVEKARPNPTKSLDTTVKSKNKAARKLPKKFLNKPKKLKKPIKKN